MTRAAAIAHPSGNFGPRRAAISMVVIHYTAMESSAASLARLCDPQSQVSAHYLIAAKGDLFALVAEEMRAWHAGEAYWRGIRDVNSAAIGIELQNRGHSDDFPQFSPRQIARLIDLLGELAAQYAIAPHNIVGHQDVAPMRKTDPGPRFPWHKLAAARLSLPCWDARTMAPAPLDIGDLHRIGYDPQARAQSVIDAFCLRARIAATQADFHGALGGAAKRWLREIARVC